MSQLAQIIAMYVESRLMLIPNDGMQRFEPVLQYMREHLSENVTVPELAKLVHLTTSHFIDSFKKCFSATPLRYFNNMRVEKAANLLTNTDMSIENIAKSIGIQDRLYFSSFFKRYIGSAPAEYRKMIAKLQ